ncbi:hypothetical protein ACFQT0_21235 [Hymenobacter humi]|uniref:Uncharacterized protein n=1 Tax=Hymenobacter humi TaxID=1411620 RepID=A0ABW2UAY5_9BACT
MKNFAEVSKEMVEEVQQVLADEHLTDLAAAAVQSLLHDLGDMQQKIGQHSLRADAIVKGMLEHSRSSAGSHQAHRPQPPGRRGPAPELPQPPGARAGLHRRAHHRFRPAPGPGKSGVVGHSPRLD